MTKQDYWEMIQAAVADGTLPSKEPDNTCLYRLDRTASCKQRCVAGMLISDEKYHYGLEYNSVSADKIKEVIELPEEVTWDMLTNLQRAHDQDERWSGEAFLNKAQSILFPEES